MLFLKHRLTGEVDAQLLENFLVHIAQHNRAMGLASAQLGKLLKSTTAVVVMNRQHRQSHKHLVGV